MSEIKVVKRFASARRRAGHGDAQHRAPKVVLIGASTGGPPVLKTILSGLPREFPLPILIVQHIAKGFLQGLADWLDASSPLTVTVGREGQNIQPGHVYLAPDGFDMGLSRPLRLYLSPPKNTVGPCPSVSYLFRSAVTSFGAQSVAVLLSGMGKDGAEELAVMKHKGAITIAQEEKTCAIKLDGATHILPPEKIAPMLERIIATKLHHRS
jgi:two-component system chemotaxis response regulator CheB